MSIKPDITLIGADDTLVSVVKEFAAGAEINPRAYDDSLFENAIVPTPAILICLPPPEGLSISEVAQTLRMFYPNQPLYFLTTDRQNFQRSVYQKNGFNDVFLIPNDRTTFRDELRRQISNASSGQVRAFRPVQLIDIEPNVVLGFDLYLHLPANNRKIKYVSSSDELDSKKAENLRKHRVQSAMVTEDQIQSFYKFTAKQLKNLGKGLSATEAKEKKERAIRELFSGIFSDSGEGDSIGSGRQIMADCQEIVKAYIVEDGDGKSSWYSKMMKTSSSTDTPYDHAANTATFAALLSIGLGIGDPKELALAGILHDIGLADVDPSIVAKPEKERTPEEQKVYEQHPLHSIKIIRERKIIVSEKVMKMVEQHHERFDGTGFPNKLLAGRMTPEAQVLAIADQLDELTATIDKKVKLSMADAIATLCQAGMNNPSVAAFNPDILRQLSGMFAKAA